MKILFKFPTKNRPEKFFTVLDQYYAMIDDKDNFQFVISLDQDDAELPKYVKKLLTYPKLNFHIGLSRTKIEAINRDVELYQDWDVLVVVADDMIPQIQGFDNIIRSFMKKTYPDGDGVLFFNDGYTQLNTLPILGKKYYDRSGWIYYPGYISLYADNDFMERAKVLNKQTYVDMVIIKHEHPLRTGGAMDKLYQKNEDKNLYIKDEAMYRDRISSNFDLDLKSFKEDGPTISICMIVKNEERNLLRLLPNLTRFADEIVIVDTGSTDKTKDIIQQFGLPLYEHPWENGKINFAAARNVSIDNATKDYIWWIDADDDLPFMSYIQAKRMLKDNPNIALMVTLISLQGDGNVFSGQLRIFPRRDDIRFVNRVHEQVLPDVNKAGIKLSHLDVPLYHLGYQSKEEIKAKLLRNLKILKQQDEEEEGLDFASALAMSRSLAAVGQFPQALERIDQAFKAWKGEPSDTSKDFLIMAFLTKASVLDVMGFHKEAIETLQGCERIFPKDKVVCLSLGEFYCRQGQYKEAYKTLNEVKDIKFKVGLFPINVPQMEAAERNHVLTCSLHVGDFALAEKAMREILNDPNYVISRTAM